MVCEAPNYGGGAPDIGLKPMDFPTTDPNGGPSLLYQQYSTHQYDQKLTDVSDPKENARIFEDRKSLVIQDPIKQRHFNVEQMSGKTFLYTFQVNIIDEYYYDAS